MATQDTNPLTARVNDLSKRLEEKERALQAWKHSVQARWAIFGAGIALGVIATLLIR